MKRTPLSRKTPMTNCTPLQRSAGLPRKGFLPAMSARRIRDRAARRQREHALGRDVFGLGECAMCGRFGEVHGHELDGAGFGKRWAAPDALLCNLDNGMVEDMPISAAWNGWKRSTKHPRDPALPLGAARRADGSYYYFTGVAS